MCADYFHIYVGIQQKSLLATTNYKARELGVKKMMGLKEAQAICPQLILVNGEDLTHYREMSYRISGRSLLRSILQDIRYVSIDNCLT